MPDSHPSTLTPIIRWSSDTTIQIAWDHQLPAPTPTPLHADQIESRAAALRDAIDAARRAHTLPGILDCLATATTVQVLCDPRGDPQAVFDAVTTLAHQATSTHLARATSPRHITIPVCYDPRVWSTLANSHDHPHAHLAHPADFSRDLAEVAHAASMTIDDLIAAHAAAHYRVQFLGFAPGFAYLAGLPTRLHVPRLPSPRPIVPAGSVAIAAAQAGVYALPTPGGWRLLGRTPLTMFNPQHGPLLRAGDVVQFEPISWDRYTSIIAASNRQDHHP